MKRILGVAFVLAATTASATEVKFGDLNYFLTQGRSQLSLDSKWDTSEVTPQNIAGQTKTETEGLIAKAKYAFAISDTLNVYVGANYTYDNKVMPDGGTQTTKDGLQNPILGINLRAANQATSGFNLDFGAIAKVALSDEKNGSSNGQNKKNGNASQRSSLELNARLGNKWDEANEFYLAGGLVYNQSGQRNDTNAAGSDVNSNLDSSYDVYLGGFYQYRPVNEFMITLGAEARRIGSVDADASGTNYKITDHMDYKFSFGAKYLITENFIARFDYVGANLADYKNKVDGASDQKYTNRRYMSMGLGVDFLF
jgi:hypothetical protein